MGIALALGVFLGVRASGAGGLWPILIIITSALILAVVNRGISRTLLCLVASGCALGWAAGTLHGASGAPPYAGPPSVTTGGRVISDPVITPTGVSAQILWTDANGESRTSWLSWSGGVEARRGDSVKLQGDIDGRDAQFVRASSLAVTSDAGWLDQQRHAVRERLESIVRARVPGSEGSLALGLLIGDDSGLPSDVEQDIRAAGLSHITAVSGWNVSLVIGSVGLAFGALRLRGWFWTAIQVVALAAFVWIVGFDPPVMRAALMAIVVLAAARLGRPAHGPTILALAAAGMLLARPAAGGTLSFQLSFLATAGLIAADRLVVARGMAGAVLKPITATIAAGLLTAPLLAAEFGTASPGLLPANIVAGPLVAGATFAAIATIGLSWFGPFTIAAGALTWTLAHGILTVARVTASIPFTRLDFGPLGPAAASLIYLALGIAMFAVLPEGRFVIRRLHRWLTDDPGRALLASASASIVAIVGTITV